MNHPIITAANAKLKYDDMLKDAEIHNRLKKNQAGHNGQPGALLSGLGDKLISVGKKLKGQGVPQVGSQGNKVAG
jgi:hypothetical protein